ncbi:type II secretion system F family protein [Enterobacteriaceae bacterium ESL0689]|nr:type II secretion system F family protein [Enterobacteriaceae bacterium ESL0689]
MLFYMIALIFLMIGAGGLSHLAMKKKRRDQIAFLIQQSSQQRNDTSTEIVTPIERIMRKSSRLVSVSAMLDKNFLAKVLIALVLIVILLFINLSGIYTIARDMLAVYALIIIALVILLPSRIKESAIKRKMKSVSLDLPFVIDLMAVCVQSGMSIEKAIHHIAENFYMINPAIATLFERAVLKTEVNGINAALEQLYEEVPSKEVRMLCSTLQQSIKYGSSVYQVLIDLSQEMREIQLLNTEEKVASLSAKMSLPMIILIMFPLLVIVAGPGLIRMASQWSV